MQLAELAAGGEIEDEDPWARGALQPDHKTVALDRHFGDGGAGGEGEVDSAETVCGVGPLGAVGRVQPLDDRRPQNAESGDDEEAHDDHQNLECLYINGLVPRIWL